MRINLLTPLGASVDGLPINTLDQPTVHQLRVALGTHGVIVLRDGALGSAADHDEADHRFLRFLRSFGDTMFTAGETPVPGCPALNVISNIGRTTPPKSVFHVDTSYVDHPPAYTALRAVEVPETGGRTLFSDQYRAYDTLDPALRRLLAGRTVTHVVTGVDLPTGEQGLATHPVFPVHPVTGRTTMYLTSPARCVRISGIEDHLVPGLIKRLHTHATRPENVLAHRWSPGDVVMWDNRAVMHRADHDGVIGNRVMHRGMVASRSPQAAI